MAKNNIEVQSILFDIKRAKDSHGLFSDEVALECTNQAGEKLYMVVKRQDLVKVLAP